MTKKKKSTGFLLHWAPCFLIDSLSVPGQLLCMDQGPSTVSGPLVCLIAYPPVGQPLQDSVSPGHTFPPPPRRTPRPRLPPFLRPYSTAECLLKTDGCLCLSKRNQDCWTHKKIIKSLTIIECGRGEKHRAFPQPSQRPHWENEQF